MIAPSSSPSPSPSPSPSRCPPSALSIAGRAGHAFTPHAMIQGFACHARGVELVTSAPGRAHARVRSKRLHDVLLRVEGGRLVVACTCPARSFGLDVCKHAWAALLEVDRQDGLSDLRKTRGPLVVVAAPIPAAPASADAAATLETAMTAPRTRSKKRAASTPASTDTTAPAKKASAQTVTKPGRTKTTTASSKKASGETATPPRGTEATASKKKAAAETARASASTKARPRNPVPPSKRR